MHMRDVTICYGMTGEQRAGGVRGGVKVRGGSKPVHCSNALRRVVRPAASLPHSSLFPETSPVSFQTSAEGAGGAGGARAPRFHPALRSAACCSSLHPAAAYALRRLVSSSSPAAGAAEPWFDHGNRQAAPCRPPCRRCRAAGGDGGAGAPLAGGTGHRATHGEDGATGGGEQRCCRGRAGVAGGCAPLATPSGSQTRTFDTTSIPLASLSCSSSRLESCVCGATA